MYRKSNEVEEMNKKMNMCILMKSEWKTYATYGRTKIYIGVMIIRNGRVHKETRNRIIKANRVYYSYTKY